MTCPFCENRFQDAAFAKSINFFALYNVAPILPGHSLIIPSEHVESLIELHPEQLNEMMLFARNVTTILLKAFKAESFNWSIQDKEAAGQTIAHLHLHIVPRFKNDLPEPGDWYPKIEKNFGEILDSVERKKLSSEEMQKIVEVLRKESKMRGFWY